MRDKKERLREGGGGGGVGWEYSKCKSKRKKIFSFDISLWISLWLPSVPLFYEKILHGERNISFVYFKEIILANEIWSL